MCTPPQAIQFTLSLTLPTPSPSPPSPVADAIDENYGVAVVFHEEERDEGGKTENVVSQEQDPTADVRLTCVCVCVCLCLCLCLCVCVCVCVCDYKQRTVASTQRCESSGQ